jgi:hypothetical protein
MTIYTIQLRLNQEQFRALVEQSNINGKSLQVVAASLIGDNLEKLAAQRERDRRAMIDRLSRQIGKPPLADPRLARRMDLRMLRQLAGIPNGPVNGQGR